MGHTFTTIYQKVSYFFSQERKTLIKKTLIFLLLKKMQKYQACYEYNRMLSYNSNNNQKQEILAINNLRVYRVFLHATQI